MAVLDRIAFIFLKMLNAVCFSHTFENVGNHLVIPTLLEFGSVWIPLFRHSYKAKLLWKDLTGQRPRSYSEMRWWSKWEVYRSEYRLTLSRRAHVYFAGPFLARLLLFAPCSSPNHVTLWHNYIHTSTLFRNSV